MANTVQTYVEGLVYRGRPPGSDQPGAWHVEIGQSVDIAGVGRTLLPTLTLTPSQALAAGYTLAGLMEGLNTESLAAAETARASAQTLTQQRDAAREGLAQAVAERDGLRARLAALSAAPADATLTRRQFFEALARASAITQDEALAAVKTGTLPARIADAVRALPEDQRFSASMLLSGATGFARHHPMVAQLGKILGKDDAALDALWAAAAQL